MELMKNETLRTIHTRRTCRAYSPVQISDTELQTILEAGTWAPTGMGMQSPMMIAVQNKADRDELARLNAAVMGDDGDPFYGAPTVVVVLADTTCGTCVEDGSLVLGTLLLAAESIGVSGGWIHRAKEVMASPEGQALLRKWGVAEPEKYVGVGNCILGYAAEGGKGEPAPRKDGYTLVVE